MPPEETKILEFNPQQKPNEVAFIIFADLDCIIETIHGPKNNPGNSYTTKVSQHIPSAFSMSTTMMHLESQKTSMMHTDGEMVSKIFVNFQESMK